MSTSDDTLMLQTPFHRRVAAACELNCWGDWKGYTTPSAYTDVELEYFAVRNTTGVFDLSPMNKYRITGPDAEAYLNRLVTRDVSRIAVGRVGYTVWCDEAGQVLDDGTVFHLGDNDYRLCAWARALDWLLCSALGFDVQIEDETAGVAALAVQGPTSCANLRNMGLAGLEHLKPFGMLQFDFQGEPLLVSRTGFTGDLGYELWIAPPAAEALWDALFGAAGFNMIKPFGMQALDLARIEAGFIQAGVDFVPAQNAVRPGRSRSPFELGLGWLVDFDKPVFNGRRALFGVARDLRSRIGAEARLRASEEMFAKAFHASTTAMSVTSVEDGRFLDANDAFLQLTGYRRDEIIGRSSTALGMYRYPAQRSHMKELVAQTGTVRDLEIVVCNRHGGDRTVLFSADTIVVGAEPCLLSQAR
ncbi:MAG: PAS domain S-box protein, partial [Anaerolineae bacterium]